MNTWPILVLVILQVISICGQGICTLPSGNEGICTPIKQCLSALALLKAGTKAKVCGEADGLPLVCCDQRSIQLTEQQAGAKAEKYCSQFVNYLAKKYDNAYAAYGGKRSLAFEFPHMAALGFKVDDKIVWGCGGSLISDKFVLTAAHCIANKNLGEVKQVRLGDLNLALDTDNARPEDFQVANVYRHPDYKSPSRYNDIALIKLNRSVDSTIYAHMACLNTDPNVNPDGGLIATGWGLLKFAGEPADHLQKLELNLVNFEECNKHYPPERKLDKGILDDSQLCAGHPSRDTCEGDSGGPLQRFIHFDRTSIPRVHTVYGVTSFGKACGLSSSPGVYTRVSKYMDWIESIVWPN
ncbi:PREDICTED: venom protease-like [Nicrophorus vespilloides]|uniref:CLIP domain-containing serine protease n=1 Tax=Nicrophorus vespilloides TaxID=110193 RepID=A0ABM1M5W1_NICVS|nr:PREDICTED: venom protease-like [Nicrophorus vespilloides]